MAAPLSLNNAKSMITPHKIELSSAYNYVHHKTFSIFCIDKFWILINWSTSNACIGTYLVFSYLLLVPIFVSDFLHVHMLYEHEMGKTNFSLWMFYDVGSLRHRKQIGKLQWWHYSITVHQNASWFGYIVTFYKLTKFFWVFKME